MQKSPPVMNVESDRRIIEEIDDGYWEVDLSGRLTFFNNALSRMTGIPAEELKGMDYRACTSPETARKLLTIFKEVYRTGTSASLVDVGIVKKDGAGATLELSVSLMRDTAGKPVGFRGVSRDITPRKKAEEEIHAYREHLALINQILRHDLTNDLLVTQKALELYGRSPEEDLLREASERVRKSMALIGRMRELESFIALHKELKACEIGTVVREVAEGYPFLDFAITGKALVMADSSLFSVIDNIVRNAVIHGRADTFEVRINRRADMCEVLIADNGSGIPDGVRERIFDEGFIYGETGHTGLGLHIVKRIMETYGGHVHVRKNEPTGAIFTLIFKRVE